MEMRDFLGKVAADVLVWPEVSMVVLKIEPEPFNAGQVSLWPDKGMTIKLNFQREEVAALDEYPGESMKQMISLRHYWETREEPQNADS